MLGRGLLAEARGLLERHGPLLPALRSIGYRQACDALLGKCSVDECEREIVKETLRLAKRQMTWFRKEPGISWFSDADAALAAARQWLALRPTSL